MNTSKPTDAAEYPRYTLCLTGFSERSEESRSWLLTHNSLRVVGVLIGLFCFALIFADAETEIAKQPASGKPEFSAFRLLIDRNIFSSTRKPPPPQSEAASTPSYQSKTIRLMGVWIGDGRDVALFEGEGDLPHEGVKRGDTILGYRVVELRTRAVLLQNDKETIEVSVGAGLASKEDGTWTVVDKPAVAAPPASSASNADAQSPESGKTEKADDPAERLRRRRRQELGS